MSSEWSLPFRFSDQHFVYISHLPHACYMTHPSHPSYDHPNIWWSIKLWSSSLWSLLQPSACPSHLGTNILRGTLFSDILGLCSSLSETESRCM
jgi:hypothetical protein